MSACICLGPILFGGEEWLARWLPLDSGISAAHSKYSPKVKKRLSNYAEGTKDHDEALEALSAVQACKDMQIGNLASLAVADMVTRYNKIITYGIDFPAEHHQHITKYVLTDAAATGQLSVWGKGLQCRILGEKPEWSMQRPVFAACLPDEADLESSKFRDTYQITAFCPTFMQHVTKVCQGTVNPSFLSSCLVVLSSLDTDDEFQEAMEEWLLDIVDPVRKVMKGFLALLSPVPLLGNSRIADVKYLFPEDGKSSLLVRQGGKQGRLIQAKVRESAFLKTKREAYMKKAGVEAQHGQPLLELHQRAAAAATADEGQDATPSNDHEDLYSSFAANAGRWHQTFRRGCTVDLQHNLMKLLRQDVQRVVDSADPELDKARVYHDALALFTVPGADALRQSVSGVLSQWQEAASRSSILSAARAIHNAEHMGTKTQEFHDALEKSEEANLTPEDAPTILQAFASCVLWLRLPESQTFWPRVHKLLQKALSVNCCWLSGQSQQDCLNLCERSVRLFGCCADVQTTVAKWDAVEPAKRGFDSFDRTATDGIISELTDNVARMMQAAHEKHDMPKFFDTDDLRAEWEAVVQAVQEFSNVLRDEDASDAVQVQAVALRKEARSALHFLQQVCKGASGGKHWYDGCDQDLMVHFDATLKVAETKQIISLRDTMKQAAQQCTANCQWSV